MASSSTAAAAQGGAADGQEDFAENVCTTQLYLFPGNPYVYELYHHLLELLEAQGKPRHGVTARLIRYADVPDELLQDPSAAFRHIAADAERQVAEHEQSREGPAPQRTVFVGHSFGSYIANLLVPSLSPHASIYIFPFLARPTLKGRMTLAVADRAYRRTPLIGAALHSFTTRVFDLVLHAISSPTKRRKLPPTDPRLLRAIFRVAAMEREEIGGKPDLSHVDLHGERHGTKAFLVYTEGDEWSPRYVWDSWPAHRRHDLSPVPHAFPCQEQHDREVCATVLRILEQVHAEEEEGDGRGVGVGVRARL